MNDDVIEEDASDVQESICIAFGHTSDHVFSLE